MSFPCTSCGACCRRIGDIVQRAKQVKDPSDPLIAAFAAFPYSVNSDGHCTHLNASGTCNIYSSRPNICRIDTLWEYYFQYKGLYSGMNAYYTHNAQVCNQLIQLEGLDARYLIAINTLGAENGE